MTSSLILTTSESRDEDRVILGIDAGEATTIPTPGPIISETCTSLTAWMTDEAGEAAGTDGTAEAAGIC